MKIRNWTLNEILDNYKDRSIYNNADEAFEAFISDYDEELNELEGEFGRMNAEGEASCILNDYYESN